MKNALGITVVVVSCFMLYKFDFNLYQIMAIVLIAMGSGWIDK